MKINIFIIILLILALILNIINYEYFTVLLSITWYIASILILYSSVKYSFNYKFIQLRIKKIYKSLKSKSNNDISPLSSLNISLAAKIGVGSLSGVSLCLYYGGLGSIFWLCIISLLVSINTYLECLLGIKYREKYLNTFVGGPSYYIKKCLNNKNLAILYSILIIITYSGLFLSIQTNTIISSLEYLNISKIYLLIFLLITTFIIINKGLSRISKVNSILVPIMIIFYIVIGSYIFFSNISLIFNIFKNIIKSAFDIKSIIPVFLIGMQRAIFITESSLGTSAISASSCDNAPHSQGLLEVLGIHIVTFIISLITVLIIVTSNYEEIIFHDINGIEILLYAFNYHFGKIGMIILSIITVLFAYSTIISSYFFGLSNLSFFSLNKKKIILFRTIFILIILISCYIKPKILWNLCDYFIAILAIINISSIIKIYHKKV